MSSSPRWWPVAVLAVALAGHAGPRSEPAPESPLMSRARELRAETLEPRFEALKPLHAPMKAPQPGDWLAEHPEPGQSVAEYLKSRPVRATKGRRTIFLQPIGPFTPAQQKVLARTADFIARFYQLPVKTLPTLDASVVPAKARRIHPSWGVPQILTTWVLGELLVPKRTDDALALLALTAEDLYPAEDWNFVFGQASLEERVGVWSLARNGDAEKEPERYLLRTLQTAVHELGHMLSVPHCVAYDCVMNGSNSRQESDLRPLELCPSCLQKLAWNIGFDPRRRFTELAAFHRAARLEPQRAAIERSLAALPR